MSDISSSGASVTNDCGVPTCSYKIQDTNVASVCSNPAAVSQANFPSDTINYIQWKTGDTTTCAAKNNYNNYNAIRARKDVDNGYQAPTSPTASASATDHFSVCL
jgi:hypothetical protein